MKKRAGANRRGFVFVTAVLLIALVGAAMGAMFAVVAADARRTLDRARDAQLEQMLLAAAAAVPVHLSAQAPVEGQSWNVELPTSLSSDRGALQVRVGSAQPGGPATLSIRAILDNRHAEQTATFGMTNNTWELIGAELGDQ